MAAGWKTCEDGGGASQFCSVWDPQQSLDVTPRQPSGSSQEPSAVSSWTLASHQPAGHLREMFEARYRLQSNNPKTSPKQAQGEMEAAE